MKLIRYILGAVALTMVFSLAIVWGTQTFGVFSRWLTSALGPKYAAAVIAGIIIGVPFGTVFYFADIGGRRERGHKARLRSIVGGEEDF